MKTKILLALWIAIYLAFTFERPGVGQGPPRLQGTTIWIPALLWCGLYTKSYLPRLRFWKLFERRFWKPLVLSAIVITPLLDLLFKYTPLTSPILPGTFTSVGLVGVITLLVWRKYPHMSFRIFAIGIIASFLAVHLSELEYQTRFTLHFFGQPLSVYDVLVETKRLPIVLVPCIYVLSKAHIMPTRWTWMWVGVIATLLAIIWQSQYFLMYWDGTRWALNDVNALIYMLNRVCKLALMAMVVSFNYTRSVEHEKLSHNQLV